MRPRLVLAAVTVVAAAVAVLIWAGTRGGTTTRAAPRPSSPPTMPAPPTSTVPAGPPHEVVPASTPTRLRISGPAFTIDAHVCAMPWALDLDPPGEQHHTVCWVRNKIGQAPSSNGTTSYLLGHSWGQDPLEVLNKLSSRVTAHLLAAKPVTMSGRKTYPVRTLDGYRITVWTRTGRLEYTVRQTFGVGKQDWGWIRQVHDDTIRNRLVLTTCAERKGVDYPYNIVVEAYLTSSVASAA